MGEHVLHRCRDAGEGCRSTEGPAFTSRNLFSCRSWPFSPRSCVTMRMASEMMWALSVLDALPGSSTFARSAKLRQQALKLSCEVSPSLATSSRLHCAYCEQGPARGGSPGSADACCSS